MNLGKWPERVIFALILLLLAGVVLVEVKTDGFTYAQWNVFRLLIAALLLLSV